MPYYIVKYVDGFDKLHETLVQGENAQRAVVGSGIKIQDIVEVKEIKNGNEESGSTANKPKEIPLSDEVRKPQEHGG